MDDDNMDESKRSLGSTIDPIPLPETTTTVTVEHIEVEDTDNRDFPEKLIDAFFPLYSFLNVVGQLPFEIHEPTATTYQFRFRKFGIRTILFACTFAIYMVTFIIITFGIISDYFELTWLQKEPYMLDLKPSFRTFEPRRNVTWESAMMENHKAVIYTIYALLFTSIFGNLHVLIKGRTHIHYFNYWIKVVELTKIDPTSRIEEFYQIQFGLCILQIFFDLLFFFFFNGMRAMAGIYVCWLLRLTVSQVPGESWFFLAQIIVMIFLTYGHLGTRAIIIQFLFFCLMLRNMSNAWNLRFRRGISTYMARATSELKKNREDFRSLLRDHLIIVQLFKMTDVTFAIILKVYYGTQLCCIMLQMAHFWKLSGYIPIVAVNNSTYATTTTISPEIMDFKYRNDFTEGLLTISICLMTIAMFSMVARSSQNANDEAMSGFQIVRRRGLMDCETKSERNFLYTLTISYARNNPITLSINGYSILNKGVTLAMFATISGHLIHFIQYEVEKYHLPKEAYRHKYTPPFF